MKNAWLGLSVLSFAALWSLIYLAEVTTFGVDKWVLVGLLGSGVVFLSLGIVGYMRGKHAKRSEKTEI